MSAPAAQPLPPRPMRTLVRQWVRALIFFAVQAAILFAASGRLNWISAWIYIGYFLVAGTATSYLLARFAPDLIEERVSAFEQSNNWDKRLVVLLAVVGPLLFCLVAGLDSRFGWSYRPGIAVRALALGAAILGAAFILWAMFTNRFFSSIVRIQAERGHAVVTSGPYRFVRHPGYVGMSVNQLAYPLMLGTLWAFVPAVAIVAVIIVRTAREDAFLHRELSGYAEYAAQVRFRLLPGVW